MNIAQVPVQQKKYQYYSIKLPERRNIIITKSYCSADTRTLREPSITSPYERSAQVAVNIISTLMAMAGVSQ